MRPLTKQKEKINITPFRRDALALYSWNRALPPWKQNHQPVSGRQCASPQFQWNYLLLNKSSSFHPDDYDPSAWCALSFGKMKKVLTEKSIKKRWRDSGILNGFLMQSTKSKNVLKHVVRKDTTGCSNCSVRQPAKGVRVCTPHWNSDIGEAMHAVGFNRKQCNHLDVAFTARW